MCGIFSLLNNDANKFSQSFIHSQFIKGQNRGPEFSKLTEIAENCIFGFHRLAINGLNTNSNQPLIVNNIAIICNGEIYNYKELYSLINVSPTTDSDCEIIIHLYKKYGIEQTLQMIDGVFAFVLCDYRVSNELKLYISRDPYGVRPLYQFYNTNSFAFDTIFGFASELKVLNEFYNQQNNEKSEYEKDEYEKSEYTINQFTPGTYSYFTLQLNENAITPLNKYSWIQENKNVKYHSTGFNSIMYNTPNQYDCNYMSEIYKKIRFHFMNAIKKRVLVTNRPIACLLSGGLDSSLVAALVNEYHKQYNSYPLETFCIGLENSEDLKYANIVAAYLGTKHTSIILTEQDFLDAIPEVIQKIESYDTTTVRASIGNYLVAKHIATFSDAKVIFNGDGSDELCGGYLYMHSAPDAIEFDRESRRLLNDIYLFDVLRSDKCISSNGLEPRTPFLDRSFVQYYLGLHPELRYHTGNGQCEKFLLRTAFSKQQFLNNNDQPLLPDNIIWRTKEAFSDGVSNKTRSLYQIIQEFVCLKLKSDGFEKGATIEMIKSLRNNTPDTDEKIYYRKLFEEYYPNMSHLLPYFWMPKYVNATDASARTLDIYKTINNK